MEHYINIFIKSVFVENMVFAFFLGMCSFLAVSKTIKTAFGLGIAVVFVLLITAPFNYLMLTFLLNEGALSWISPEFADVDLSFLSLILFIAVIAGVVQLVEMLIEKFLPTLYNALGIFLPLITVNCAILGSSLFMAERSYDFPETVVFSAGSGIGFFLAIVALASLRERLKYSDVPGPLKGLGLAMLITGLMGIAFLSFSGIKL